MNYMETLSQAINKLQIEGYTSGITPDELGTLNSSDWVIKKIQRFEGNTNPSDNSILYAIERKDGTRKALLINAYGVYNDSNINAFISKVEDKHNIKKSN